MVHIPYGRTVIEYEENGANVLYSRIDELKAEGNGFDIVKAAMENPIDSPRLSELAKGKKNCVIVISDHTRPVPSKDILPNMFAELKEGSPDIEITLLVATGSHRPSSPEELIRKLGQDIYDQVKIVIHDSRDPETNVQVGTLPSGAPFLMDKVAAEADLLISEGFIEPHLFAGFSGGRKSILPGISEFITVYGNHCSSFIDSEFARPGKLDGNPMHANMLGAAKLSKLAYIVNVILDENKNTVAAFAGDCVSAHRKGCDFLLDYARVPAKKADIVITSNGGAPLDQNIYQSVKSMVAAEGCVNEGGVIIECSECADGHGGQAFYNSLHDCEDVFQLYDEFMATPMEKTIADQWESQVLARILKKATVIMVTNPGLKTVVEDMKMKYAASLDEAVAMAKAMGKESMTVIPNGISVVIE